MDCLPDVFFTEAAFEQYTLQPTCLELLQKYAPKQANDAILAKRAGSQASTQPSPLASLACPKGGWYPHFSSLTHDQHRKYLQLECKYRQHSFQGHHSQQELHDLREYRQYHEQVTNEQREFHRFAESYAKRNKEDYAFLHPLAHAYMKGVIKKWQRDTKTLPQNYALYQTIGMSVEPVVPSDPVLKHVGSLLSLGEAPLITIPGLNPHDPPTLHHMVSVKDGAADKSTERDSMELVSEDVNAKKLATKFDAGIVMSYAALEVMLNTHPPPFEQQWEIPITVSENSQGDGAPTNIIFIDKPLKQKAIFPHEASFIFHQIILQHFLNSNPNKAPLEVDSQDERVDMYLQAGVEFNDPQEAGESTEISEADALVDLETFGSGLMFPLPKKVNQCTDTSQAGKMKTLIKKEDQKDQKADKALPDQTELSAKLDTHNSESCKQTQQAIQQENHAKSVCSAVQQSTLIPDSPQSPEPVDTTPQMEVIQDSPQSPDAKSNAGTSQLPATVDVCQRSDIVQDSPKSPDAKSNAGSLHLSSTVCQKNDVVQDSPQSTDAKSNAGSLNLPATVCQKNDVVQDSPQSPDAKSNAGSLNLQATVCQKNDVVQDSPQSPDVKSNAGSLNLPATVCQKNDVVQDSPHSPDAKSNTADHGEVVQDSCTKALESEVNELTVESEVRQSEMNQLTNNTSPSKNELNISAISSASENELMIASAEDVETTGENTPKRVRKMNSSESQDVSDVGHVQTRQSKRLKACENSDDSGVEEDSNTTRRRSARLRKAVDGTSSELPVKKVKRTTDSKEKDMCESVEYPKVETGPCEKTENARQVPSNSVCKESTVPNLDSTKQITDTSCNLEPNTSQNCTTDSQSLPCSKAAESVKETSKMTSIASNKSRAKMRGQGKKEVKLGGVSSTMKGQQKDLGVSSTIDTIMKLQEKLHTRRQQKADEMPSDGASLADSQLQNPMSIKPENPADYVCPKDGNVSYNLWKLGKLSVLIRTRDHGMVQQSDGQNSQSNTVTVIPKMEYQAHFGFEQMGLSELCQIWANLFIRPGSKVIQGCIDAFTSQLLRLEWLDLNNPMWMQCPFNPARSMKMVHTICDKLQGLPKGKYLLSHNPGDTHASVHLALEEHSKKKVTYDLHKAHATSPLQTNAPAVLPWLPLDPKIPLIGHIEQKIIPLTFPPRPPGMKLHPTGQGNSKKKKGKKKKTMQASR